MQLTFIQTGPKYTFNAFNASFLIHFSGTAFLGLPRIYIDINKGYQIRFLNLEELSAAEEGLNTSLIPTAVNPN